MGDFIWDKTHDRGIEYSSTSQQGLRCTILFLTLMMQLTDLSSNIFQNAPHPLAFPWHAIVNETA